MPIWFLYSSIFIVVCCANLISGSFGTYRNILYQSGISGQDAQSASVTCSVFFPSVGSVSQRKVASGRAAAEEGCLLLGLRETALLRQGLLSEPKASFGPAAMLLAVSRSPSSIPRRSPCPDRCHLPLASLSPSPKNF